MDKFRIGQTVLVGENSFDEHTIITITKDDFDLLYVTDDKKSIRSESIVAILSGPTQPETEDVEDTITVQDPYTTDYNTEMFRWGDEVVFTSRYLDAEIEIEGYVLVPGRSWCVLTEKGISIPNRHWRVHKNAIRLKNDLKK